MKNVLIKTGIKNTIYVIASQLTILVIGICKSLILPMFLGIKDFGYWQIYVFYSTYLGFFALGFNDGIYLRYGKYDYEDLPHSKIRSSIRLFIIMQIIMIFLCMLFVFAEHDINKKIALFFVCFNILIFGLTGILVYVFQITNQIKKYSVFSTIDKIIFLIAVLLLYLTGKNNYVIFLIVDTFSKIVVLIFMMITCKELFVGKNIAIKKTFIEFKENISVGIKLMLAGIMSMLITGLGRFIVERTKPIEIFSQYSLAISMINLVLIFVNAISLVFYPLIARVDVKQYKKIFNALNDGISILAILSLLLYFPLQAFIKLFLPQYSDVLFYLPFMFGTIFAQSKMQIIYNTFYKVLRQEKKMFLANFSCVIVFLIITLPLYIYFKNVNVIAFGTFLAMILRIYISERYLKREMIMTLSLKKNILEIVTLVIFLYCSLEGGVKMGVVYLIVCFIYTSIHYKSIQKIYLYLKK